MNDVNSCKHEETDLSQSAAAVKKLKTSVTTTVYAASGSNLYGFYDWQAAAMADPSLQGFFLTSIKAGRLGDCPFSYKEWDWRNASARDYFVDKIVGPWVKNDAVDAIFIDEGDAVMCRNQTGLPTEEMFKWANGSFEVYRRSAASLAAVNKRLVLSLKNGYVGAEPEEPKVPACPVPYDAVVEYMQPVPWIRYHEYFGTLEESQKSTMCHNLMATAVKESATENLAFSAHGGNYTASTTLELTFAMFMVARNATAGGEMDYYGWSTAPYWYSRDWKYNETAALFNQDYGEALGPPMRDGQVWSRRYQRATFSVDCQHVAPTITLRAAA